MATVLGAEVDGAKEVMTSRALFAPDLESLTEETLLCALHQIN
jgi:hypothetical protein